MTQRTLSEIAFDIRKSWTKPYFGAIPYLQAVGQLQSIEDDYCCDSAKSVVLYFLANANTWRGQDAKRIKTELKALCKSTGKG